MAAPAPGPAFVALPMSAPAPAPRAAPPKVVLSRGVKGPPAQPANVRASAKHKPFAVEDVIEVTCIHTSGYSSRIPVNESCNLRTISFRAQDETSQLFAVIPTKRGRAIFLTACRYGLRASEVGLLQITDANIERGRLTLQRLTLRHRNRRKAVGEPSSLTVPRWGLYCPSTIVDRSGASSEAEGD
jgi:hypothetical protein